MFEKVLLEDISDIGTIVETLLFYDKVHFLFSERSLRELFQRVDPRLFIPFIEEHKESIKLDYIQSDIAISTYDNSKTFGFRIAFPEDIGDEGYLRYLRKSNTIDTPNGFIKDKQLVNKLLTLLNGYYSDQKELNSIIEEVNKENYFLNYFKSKMKTINNSNILTNVGDFFKVESTGDYGVYYIKTNLENVVIEGLLNQYTYDTRYMLLLYCTNILSMIRSAKYKSDILSSAIDSEIIQHRAKALIEKTKLNNGNVQLFQDVCLMHGKMLKEVMNSGEKNFNDFITIYEKSLKFKKWLRDIPNENNLVEEYYKEVLSETWGDKLPMKTVRWSIFTGAGLFIDLLGAGGIGTLVGIGLGAFDTFLLDNLFKGWKPNQFIEKELKEFVK